MKLFFCLWLLNSARADGAGQWWTAPYKMLSPVTAFFQITLREGAMLQPSMVC